MEASLRAGIEFRDEHGKKLSIAPEYHERELGEALFRIEKNYSWTINDFCQNNGGSAAIW